MRVVLLLALFSGAALAAPVEEAVRLAEGLQQQGLEQLALVEWETLVQSEDVTVRAKALNAMLRAEHPNPLAIRAAVLTVPYELIDPSVYEVTTYERGVANLEQGHRRGAAMSLHSVSWGDDTEATLRATLIGYSLGEYYCGWRNYGLLYRTDFLEATLPPETRQMLLDLQALLAARIFLYRSGPSEQVLELARLVSDDGRYASEALVIIARTQRLLRREGAEPSPELLLTDLQLYGVGPEAARQPPGEAFTAARWLGDDPDAVDLALVYAVERLDAGDCDAVIQVAEGVQARWGETWRDLQRLTRTDSSRAWRARTNLAPAVLARLMERRDLARIEAAIAAIPAELALASELDAVPNARRKLNDRRVSLERSAATVLQEEASAMAGRLEHVGTELGVAWAEALARAEAGTCVIPPRP